MPLIAYSVIIPTHNAVDTLVPLLASIAPQVSDSVEVLVIDDGSTDDTAARVADFPITYIALDKNAGPAAARNQGAAMARGEWLIFTDADTVFQADTLDQIRVALEQCRGDGLVGTYAGKPANAGLIPRYKALWEFCTINQRIPVNEQGLAPFFTWAPRPGVIRKSAFEAVGGFDARYRGADLEDLDLGYRLIDAGYRIYYAEHVQIGHHYPETLWAELVPFARRCALWIQMRRQRPRLDAAGEGAPVTALAHGCGFLATLVGAGAVVFPGMWLAAAGFLLLHWLLNQAFLRAAWREGGTGFAVACAGLTWLHSAVLGFAAGWGLLTAPWAGK